MKHVREVILAVAALALPAVALAQDARLDCPAGARQVGGQQSKYEATLCVTQTGEYNGPYVQHHPNGRLHVQGAYENGFRVGTWQFFDAQGVKTDEIEFKRGDFHGRKVAFHANGRKKVEENYVLGRREGQLRKFDAAGDIVAVEEYRGNVMVKR